MLKNKKIVSMALVATLSLSALPVFAQSGYFNTYTVYEPMNSTSYNTSMQGMTVDRYNNNIFTAKLNATNETTQLFLTKLSSTESNRTTKLLKNSTTGATSSDLGHANDLAVVAKAGDTVADVYVAPMEDGIKYANKIIKLTVNTSTGTYNVAKSYVLSYGGENLSISGITYSVGYDKFIVKSGKRFFIGNFNEDTGKFDYEATFKLNHTRAVVNGSTLDTTDYIQQGISYYEGNLYVPMAKPDVNGNASNASVVTTYPLNIAETISEQKNTTADPFSKVLYTNDNLSFRITSSAYSLFEIEGVDFDNGTMFFNTNRSDGTQQDMIATFNDYNTSY